VTAFLDSIGYDAVDVGPVAESWRQEPGTPAYGAPVRRVLGRDRDARRRSEDPRRPGRGPPVTAPGG
jgi:hypothetical protein